MGADHPRLLDQVRRREQRALDADAVHDHRDVGRTRRLDPAVGPDPLRLHRSDGTHVPQADERPDGRVGTPRRALGRALLLRLHGGRRQPVQAHRRHGAARRSRPEPAAAEPSADGVPPADALPRVRRVHHPVRVRDGGTDHRSLRRGLARRHPPHHARRVGLPHRRHHPRRVVELRGARLGRLLGLGSGRERIVAPVADGHRVHPLGDRPGTARDAPGLEPLARPGNVLSHHPGHVPHSLRRRELGPRVHAVLDRTVAAHVPRRRGRHLPRARRVASRQAARARAHRLAGVAGVCVPRQQPPLHRPCVRGAARHGVPARRGGGARQPALGR